MDNDLQSLARTNLKTPESFIDSGVFVRFGETNGEDLHSVRVNLIAVDKVNRNSHFSFKKLYSYS